MTFNASIFALGLGFAVASVPAIAAEAGHPGKSVYLRYCGACHGAAGKGDGVAGTFMRPKPTDLTTIAARNGGEFPFARVMDYIDGTADVRAHGDPDMPVWGQVFRDDGTWDAARRAAIRGKLMVITDYVQSIQEGRR